MFTVRPSIMIYLTWWKFQCIAVEPKIVWKDDLPKPFLLWWIWTHKTRPLWLSSDINLPQRPPLPVLIAQLFCEASLGPLRRGLEVSDSIHSSTCTSFFWLAQWQRRSCANVWCESHTLEPFLSLVRHRGSLLPRLQRSCTLHSLSLYFNDVGSLIWPGTCLARQLICKNLSHMLYKDRSSL